MAKYRKKPVVIEAFQMTREQHELGDSDEWPEWVNAAMEVKEGDAGSLWFAPASHVYFCGTLEGTHEVTWDDFIIQGVKGEIYPCKPDIFELTYEPA